MFVLSCRDLGFEHCKFVATGSSTGEVKDAMFAHARAVHAHFISGLTSDERQEIAWVTETVMAYRMSGRSAYKCA